MSQYPPPQFPGQGPPGPAPIPQLPEKFSPPPKRGNSLWIIIVGAVGAVVLMPCLCCGGLLAYSFTVKEVRLSNGEHLGGPPVNVKFNYAFADDGSRGLPKSYMIVAQAPDGTRHERSIVGGFGFGVTRIPMQGTWTFSDGRTFGPQNANKPVKIWIESEDAGGRRATASNTLTIYPKG